MVLIAIPLVFGPTRDRSTGQRVTAAALIGMVFSLVPQISQQLGRLQGVDPRLSALAPALLLLLLALLHAAACERLALTEHHQASGK